MKRHKSKIIATVLIFCILAAAYFWGGNYAGGDISHPAETPPGTTIPDNSSGPDLTEAAGTENPAKSPNDSPESSLAPKPDKQKDFSEEVSDDSSSCSREQEMILDVKTDKDKYLTDSVPEGKPRPVEPRDTMSEKLAYTVTLSVHCETILDNMKYLDKEKEELVPKDGIIFPATKVIFYEGESVFNVLQREMKKNKIHMEFQNTPIYNSAYILGINNIYEFDVGGLSGWMYKVNGWFPNYGASRYQLKDGDVVEWVYTCDLGQDVGGDYAAGDN